MKAVIELENFSEAEVDGLEDKLKIKLQCLRYMTGVPIYITSGLRVGDTGEHGEGEGIDISDNEHGTAVGSHWRWLILRASYSLGFKRIGDYDRHIHLGVSMEHDQMVAWWEQSS